TLKYLLLGDCRSQGQFACFPKTARPDWIVRIPVLELDPDPGIHRRHKKQAHALARIGNTRPGPAALVVAQHVLHFRPYPAQQKRIAVVTDGAAILAVKWRAFSVH